MEGFSRNFQELLHSLLKSKLDIGYCCDFFFLFILHPALFCLLSDANVDLDIGVANTTRTTASPIASK